MIAMATTTRSAGRRRMRNYRRFTAPLKERINLNYTLVGILSFQWWGQVMADRRVLAVSAFVCLSVLLTSSASAQSSYIRGVVRDTSGEPVAGATVTAENPLATRTVESETDDSGRFSLIGLRAGQWLFTVRQRGYEAVQAVAAIRRSGFSGTLTFTMEVDLSDPPPSTAGRLGGIRSDELQASLDAAHELFDMDDFQGAVAAYETLLEKVPDLTSLNLQIGDAYREIGDFPSAEAAYRRVPPTSHAGTQAELALRTLAERR